ncbi:MAG: hypothetical protein JSR63_06050 [Proteobacteria bacterium]|nr:hypothetical protein [Pseudomonadota bacterium]
MDKDQAIDHSQEHACAEDGLTGASIAIHSNTALPLPTSGQQSKYEVSPYIKPSAQAKEALALGWVVFGFSVVKSEAISQEVIAAKVLGKPNEYQFDHQLMMIDTETLSATELKKKYPKEYNSHRNAKAAPKMRGIAFDSRLRDFRNFLRHMGPCVWTDDEDYKKKRFTLERIKGKNSPYKIGNLEWASKRKQTSTRVVGRWQKLKDGTTLTIKQLANRACKKYNTVYKQLAAGKSPDEILIHVSADLLAAWAWPDHLQHLEHAYKQRTKHKQCRLLWAIELFRRYVNDAVDEEFPTQEVEKLEIELHALEMERKHRAGKMKADKKSDVQAFIAAITPSNTNQFLASALPSLPAK